MLFLGLLTSNLELPLSIRLITRPSRRRRARHSAGSDLDAMGGVCLVNRLTRGRLGRRSRIPVFVEDAAVRRSPFVNDLSAAVAVCSAAAGVAARSAAQIAAEPGPTATAAVVGAVAIAAKNPGKASQAIWFAV